jgi:Domain of unknown function (DUF6268)
MRLNHSYDSRPSRRAACLALLTWLYPAYARAQFPDLLDASAQYLPGVALQDPRPARAQVASYEGTLNVPIVLGAHTFLIPGASYHSDAVSYARTPAGFTELRAFHALELALLFVQLLPNDWSLSARLAPGLAADSPDLDTDQLRLSALALATRTFSDRLVLGAGGIASYSFGTLLPLPAAYAEWKPVDGLRIETFLPAFVDARYTFWDRLELGLRADVAGNAYAVRDERIRKAWPCAVQPGAGADPSALPADPAQCLDHVAYSVGVVGLVAGVRLFGSVWWTTLAGHSVFRRFDPRTANDERVPGGLQALPDALFVRSNLTWRMPRD